MISFVRVDNRLIHGQVVEAWLPKLGIQRVVVADEESAKSPLIRAAMGLAVQGSIEVKIAAPSDIDFPALGGDPVKTLILMRDVAGVVDARQRGLPLSLVNLGNVHFGTGRRQVSASVFLSEQEVEQLQRLVASGVTVEARGVPAEKAIGFPEILERFGKGA